MTHLSLLRGTQHLCIVSNEMRTGDLEREELRTINCGSLLIIDHNTTPALFATAKGMGAPSKQGQFDLG